jgi:hypothetical protein
MTTHDALPAAVLQRKAVVYVPPVDPAATWRALPSSRNL